MKTLFNTQAESLPIYLTDKDLAVHTPFSRYTFQAWRSQGRGPTWMKIAGRTYYKRDEVIAFFHGNNI